MIPTNLLQTGNDIDRSVYEQILQFIRLRVTETYAFPPEIVRVDDITIATLGNFSASVGKPKSKKTFNITAIVAAALSGKNVLRYNAHLPEGKHKVLYVDTEQSKCHCHKVLERILRLAGLPTDRETDNLEFFMLREYSPKQRRQIINHALASDPGIGFVVIDGIRDLLYDINSPSESVDLINDLMRWSSMHDLHIHTVLHLNKGDDNTRGHIGTELNNKAETILQITKSQFDGNISEVKAMHIREKEFKPFAFRINNDALPELVGEYSFTQERKGFCESISDVQHAQALRLAFSEGDITGYRPLIKALQQGYTEIGFKRGRNICIELNKYLMGRGIIVKQDKSYHYNPKVLEYSGCTSDKEV